MIREAFAAIGISLALVLGLASLTHAATPIGYAPCAKGHSVRCTPSLTSGRIASPQWLRVAHRGATVMLPKRVTDMHAYGTHGRALQQYAAPKSGGYAWRNRSGQTVAGYVRTDRTFYVYRACILAGWEG